jgi:hypothetical protein
MVRVINVINIRIITLVKYVLIKIKKKVDCSANFKKIILVLLKPFPTLKARLKRIGQVGINSTYSHTQAPKELNDLSPRAKQIYMQLNQAIENQKNKSEML